MKSVIVYFWLIIIVLATSWFFFWPGMFYLHDYLHTARIAEMTRALQDGHFPVRWSENFGYGYGMPLFEFYAPLPFYVGSLLTLIGIPLLMTTKALFIICNIFTTIGSYKLGTSLYGRMGGLIAAAAISLAPYRAVNLYVRGAVSESWGIMAMVWIIYFLYKTIKGSKYAWIGLSISLSVLFLSHNLLTLLFVPFSLALACITATYVLFKDRENKQEKFKNIFKLLFSYVLAIGLSAFYIFPAYLEKGYTQVEKIIVGGYFDYNLHFIYLRQFFTPSWGYGGSNWGPDDGISFFLGYGQLLSIAVAGIFLLFWTRQIYLKQSTPISQPRFWWSIGVFGLLLLSLVLSTEKSSYIWKNISLLHFVQFPWRLLSLSLVFAGILAPLFLLSQKSFVKRWLWGWLALLLFFANTIYFRPESFIEDPTQYYSGDITLIQDTLSEVLPDYLPSNASVIVPPKSIATCEGECSVELIENKIHHKKINVTTTTPSKVVFSSNYFPGWFVNIDGNQTKIEEENGLLAVIVPEGTHQVAALFGNTHIRSITDMVSFISLCILGIGIYIEKTLRYEKSRT